MKNLSLSKIAISDIPTLQNISKQTFIEAFAAVNTEANMTKYLEESLSIQRLTDEFMTAGSEFYFLENEQEIAGYLKLNFGESQTEPMGENSMEIERIYVLKAYLGRGLGQFIFDQAIEIARKKHLTVLWLGVWEENHRALNFYKKNGLVEFDKHNFILGNDLQTDVMMKIML
jgi:ribosomal protein S18 acetylase RimI-like enzyme